MKLSKNLLAAIAVTTIASGSIIGIGAASAQSSNNGQDSLVSKIAEKFNLDKTAVQSVFDEQHAAREAEIQAKIADRLQSLVDSGKITAEQKTALEAKQAEMKATREALKDQNLTREEMHTKMEEARTTFETWAKDQGIDLSVIRPEGGPMGRGDHRRGMHYGSDTTTDSQNQ